MFSTAYTFKCSVEESGYFEGLIFAVFTVRIQSANLRQRAAENDGCGFCYMLHYPRIFPLA